MYYILYLLLMSVRLKKKEFIQSSLWSIYYIIFVAIIYFPSRFFHGNEAMFVRIVLMIIITPWFDYL